MSLLLAWAALRHHPFSVLCTALLAGTSASLLGVAVPLALLTWVTTSLFTILVWQAFEPAILRRLGCRAPSPVERESLAPVLGATELQVLVIDVAAPWVGRGLRSLIITRALLDLLPERPMVGLLTQAVQPIRSANLVAEVAVWLGNVPLLTVWVIGRWLSHVGTLLALLVGGSLVVPLVLGPVAFIRWMGRACGSVLVALLGVTLVSSGLAAPGLGLMLAWALVPGLRALLAWEYRRAEQRADLATVVAGCGWQLLEALETLAYADSVPPPAGVLGLFCRGGRRYSDRADSVCRAVQQ